MGAHAKVQLRAIELGLSLQQPSFYISCATSVLGTVDGYQHRPVGVHVAH